MPFLREKLNLYDYEREAGQIRAEDRAETRAQNAELRARRRAQEERRILNSRQEAAQEAYKTQALQQLETTAAQEGVEAPYQAPAETWGVHGTMKRKRSLLDPELTTD